MMEIVGYILAVFVGVSLGLIGSGGSILTIPILVYAMGVQPELATTYSLFIVGVVAFVGVLRGASTNVFNWKMGLFFGIPSIIAIFLTRKFLLPTIPQVLFYAGDIAVTKNLFIMLLFSMLMLAASFSMILKGKLKDESIRNNNNIKIILVGGLVGTLTGIVGVGGGFLIIPSLLFFGKISIKEAIATSLSIVMINSLIGFASSDNLESIDWQMLLVFTSIAIFGIFIGIALTKRIADEKLKPAFGWFVLFTGIYILIKELIIK